MGGVLQIAPYSNKKHYPAAVAQAHRTGWGWGGLGGWGAGAYRMLQGIGRQFPPSCGCAPVAGAAGCGAAANKPKGVRLNNLPRDPSYGNPRYPLRTPPGDHSKRLPRP